jgi:peptide/nickel transport system substrate-binding protein
MAIDRQHILNTVFEKRGVLAAGPIPPELWKARTLTRAVSGYSYNPEKAKALIRQAGAEGATVKIYITLDAEVLDIIEVIQNYLTKVGLKVEIIQLDWSAMHAVNEAMRSGCRGGLTIRSENFLFHSPRVWVRETARDK